MDDIAPKLAELTDNVLFADVWDRPGLSQRDRSPVTVSALIAMNRPDQIRSHLARALGNGVTREELIEAITQLAFYTGWPSAVTAVAVARRSSRRKAVEHAGYSSARGRCPGRSHLLPLLEVAADFNAASGIGNFLHVNLAARLTKLL